MADEPKEKPDEGAEKVESPKLPETITVTDARGQSVVVPFDKAQRLAQQGLEYENLKADLDRRSASMQADERGWGDFKRLQDTLSKDPRLAEAVSFALQNPDSVHQAMRGDVMESDMDEDLPTAKASADLDPLRRELSDVREKLSAFETSKARGELDTAVQSEVASYPWLKGKQADLAKKQILSSIQTDPKKPLAVHVAAVANEFKEAWEEGRAKDLQENTDRQHLAAANPGQRSTPIAAPKEKLTKESFGDGTLHRLSMEAAEQFLGKGN